MDDAVDLISLKDKIEKQTGFPAELKVASTLLRSGWTYQSNPRFQNSKNHPSPSALTEAKLTEVDFLAENTIQNAFLQSILTQDGYITISLLVDVKRYSRPIVVFSSPLTDRDRNDIYSDIYCMTTAGKLASGFCLLHWRDGPFGGDLGGRTAVVVNNEGGKKKDFDFHQLYSTLDGLYQACKAARDDTTRLYERTFEVGSRILNVIVPIIVCDGELLSYRVTTRTTSLRGVKVASMSSHVLGEDDRLLTSCAYIVSLDYLAVFLRRLERWGRSIKLHEIEFRVAAIEGG